MTCRRAERAFAHVANGRRLPSAVSIPPGGGGTLVSFDVLARADELVERWSTKSGVGRLTG